MRNGIKRAHGSETSTEEASDAPLAGGASGVAAAVTDPGETRVATAEGKIVGSAKDAESEKLPPVVRYQVVSDTKVLFLGHTYVVKAGKIVDAQSSDLALLRKQGVRLQKIEETV
jgi:hypothetical protein